MKKIFLISIFSLFAFSIAQAQSFGGGLIGGATFSQMLGTGNYGFQKAGVVAGVFADRKIGKKAGLQLEMVFVQKGYRKVIKEPNGGGTRFSNFNVNYIEVPLLFESNLKGRFSFELGISGGIMLSTKFRTENGDCELCDPNTQPFNRFELGCLGGFNFRISDSFDLNLRYLNSIIRVRKHQGGQVFRLNRGEYNSVLQVSLRYKFKGKANKTAQ